MRKRMDVDNCNPRNRAVEGSATGQENDDD